ncbi:polysaccharide deacetylase family protein [Bifidobacterium phasiani]|uniref:Polysaccharide deacetylase family protein n=1 Tax=Bifidobacterium phasiani TaxID=2834431 RepID=A0ABS6W8J1_9BIFI|nr:polysaccharide deacetylase family protein [Bifidobacterium phasiani]MBW3082821.1 polysaccharide deacetylase family protein [Bifidobacterium phasiani]
MTAHMGRRRVHPVVVAVIALFVAALVFAGVTIARGVGNARRDAHERALEACESARRSFSTTYTTYSAALSTAEELARTPQDEVGSQVALDDLNRTLAPMTGDGDGALAPDALAGRSCNASMDVDGLDALASDLARADSTMVNRIADVQYQIDTVRDSIENQRRTNARAALRALVDDAAFAHEHSAGRVDEGLRATLDARIADARSALDGAPDIDDETCRSLGDPLRAAMDDVVAAMPFDCHFHDCVALTFDDGPNERLTPQLLDALEAAGAPGTFFVQGQFVSGGNIAIVRRMADEGHDVGSISWRHTQLHTMDADTLATWFADTDAVIEEATGGRAVTLFRPPDGAWNDAVRAQAETSGQSIVLWDVDSGDWRGDQAADIAHTVVEGARAGSIVAMHDGNQATIDAIADIVQGLRDKGLTPVTVSTLLGCQMRPGVAYYGLDETAGDE